MNGIAYIPETAVIATQEAVKVQETKKDGMFGKILGSIGGFFKNAQRPVDRPTGIQTQRDNSLIVTVGALLVVIVVILIISGRFKK